MTGTGRARVNFDDWMRDQERRHIHAERRAAPSTASDLLGPGVGPQAAQLSDWNDESIEFNGFYFSTVGALHSPDPTLAWMGVSICDPEGTGYQTVTNYDDGAFGSAMYAAWPGVSFTRAFNTAGGTSRVYSSWVPTTPYYVRTLAADQTITTTSTNFLGSLFVTVPTFTTREVYEVTASLSISHTGTLAHTLVCELQVGGVTVGPRLNFNAGGVDSALVHCTKTWLVSPLAGGGQLFQLTGRMASSSDTYVVQANDSQMSVRRVV